MTRQKYKKKRAAEKGRQKKIYPEVITTHNNADFDALGSMIAVKRLYPEAALVFPGSQEKNLRNFFLYSTSYLLDFIKLKQIDVDQVKKLIIVDTRQKSRIGRFADLIDKKDIEIHVYDHHPPSDDDIPAGLEIIQKCGATTTLLTQLIREKKLAVSPDEATLMCLGIHEDTGSFTFSSTTPADYEAAAWLTEQGADHNMISDMLTRELTPEQLSLLNDLTQSVFTRMINGLEIVFAKAIRDEYIGDFAVLVHKLMEMGNINILFALGQMDDRIYLVARSRRTEDLNVAEIAHALGGGGHPYAASVTIKNKTLIQAERSLQALLKKKIHPTRKVREYMTSPAISVTPEENLETVAERMTRYDINVLLVIDKNGELKGYITRQVVQKAVGFGLGNLTAKEYMNIEFSTIHPDTPLKEAQGLIIRDKTRVLPVVENHQVIGVITRTDLLNILQGAPHISRLQPAAQAPSQYMQKKNMTALMKETLPKNIIQYLKSFGQIGDILNYNVYLVGGLVRDILLKRENLDVDIVVEGDGIEFAREFAARHKVRIRSHKKFRTAVLVFPDGFKVDVATARMEYYESPGSAPVVETGSLKMDLYRRDFTINTLAIKLNKKNYGSLIDYFGALKDIKEKVLRVLHNLSFIEDPTRMLRAVRFEQRFDFKIGKLTRALIKNAVKIDIFKDPASRRFFLELKLILKEKDPLRAIQRVHELDLLQFISRDMQLTQKVKRLLEEIQKVIDWYSLLYLEEPFESWKIYWKGLTSELDHKTLEAIMEKHGMKDTESRNMLLQRKKMGHTLNELYQFSGTNYELYTLLSSYDTELLLYMMASSRSNKAKRMISNFFTKLKGTKILLTGKDLKNMGYRPGPQYKEIFDCLLQSRLNDLIKSRDEEIHLVKNRFPADKDISAPNPSKCET